MTNSTVRLIADTGSIKRFNTSFSNDSNTILYIAKTQEKNYKKFQDLKRVLDELFNYISATPIRVRWYFHTL